MKQIIIHPEDEKLCQTIFFNKHEVDGRETVVSRINYLLMLNTPCMDAAEAEIRIMKQVLADAENPEEDIKVLFSVRNWRPHIVGCLAMCYLPRNDTLVESLWELLAGQSWAAPQIAATVSMVDRNFAGNAAQRLSNTGLVNTGLELNTGRRKLVGSLSLAKSFLALWSLLEEVDAEADVLHQTRLIALKQDLERLERSPASDIAINWRSQLQTLMCSVPPEQI
ncbi:hypothetical protein EUZ85_15005 [Hahella sp. KA22]|uniref:hypothetical protein n=1 Tax=Hahella sp. KA22 TaxID=1628392 RepID=UPI000FDD867A|nr:hypothetical protein [Hahella sp. KA22]AZZ91969.1 hypothetical protein ENC22_12440 [Hahella sp. KA22]QAY55340.1 hypothetical protein EUZ85_15005 [Hahella sp. KA22]